MSSSYFLQFIVGMYDIYIGLCKIAFICLKPPFFNFPVLNKMGIAL